MKYSVVSINEHIVRLENENGVITEHKISEFSDAIKEGMIVQTDTAGFFYADNEETELRRNAVHKKMKRLFKKNNN